MLEFKQDDIAAPLILTLTENVSVGDPFFLFVFTHVLTKDQVIFLKDSANDESDYPQRYNQYTINPTVVFAGYSPGEWHYAVSEQTSSTNVDPAQSGAVLEYGKLILDQDPAFGFTMYDSPTTYKTYNG